MERIAEAQQAQCVFPNEHDCKVVGIIKTKREFFAIFDKMEFYVQKAIGFCYNFSVFNNLKTEEQLLMLKPFIMDLLLLRFSFTMDLESKSMPLIVVS